MVPLYGRADGIGAALQTAWIERPLPEDMRKLLEQLNMVTDDAIDSD